MASRAELVAMAKELTIDYDGMSVIEMKEAIRNQADKILQRKAGYHASADGLSFTLKKFLTKEYNYVIKDKDGNIIDVEDIND